MKAQAPAKGISLNHDFGDSASYSIHCDCTAPDCQVNMWIEVEEDHESIDLSFYVHTSLPWWKKGFNRIAYALKVLFTGNIEEEHHMVLSPQAAVNLHSILGKSIKQAEQKRKQRVAEQ